MLSVALGRQLPFPVRASVRARVCARVFVDLKFIAVIFQSRLEHKTQWPHTHACSTDDQHRQQVASTSETEINYNLGPVSLNATAAAAAINATGH